MSNRLRSTSLGLLALLALAPLAARAAEGREAAPPPPPLTFRGWALTADFQIAKVYGNSTHYDVRWYADVSGLPWDNVTDAGYGGLASDPWNSAYLYLAVPAPPADDKIYRFNIAGGTTTFLLNMPPVMNGWTLQGLGARCSSKLANLYGGIPFYSHRRYHPATSFQVRELTTAGVETHVYTSTDYSSRKGDNAQQHFGGPHWFTWEGSDPSGNWSWGVTQLSTSKIVMGTNDGLDATGLLSYGSGAYYVSTTSNKMFLVNTNTALFNPLTYLPSSLLSYPTAPDLIDLSNPANFCTVTAAEPLPADADQR